jgi:tight adherence protein C
MMSPAAIAGALVGLGAGIGVWLVVGQVFRRRAPTLDQRLAPYLLSVRLGPGPLETAGPSSVFVDALAVLLGPFMATATAWAERVSGGSGTVRLRLDQLGPDHRVEQFRAEQVLCGVLGGAAGVVVGALTTIDRGFSAVPLIGLVVIGSLVGVLGRDQLLSAQIRRREQRILAEFPAVAEMLALSVGAGEGPVGALDRVARTCRGELSAELARTLADARTGKSLVEALAGLGARSSLPSVARFVDGIAVAVERGTPLADVLRAQAQDVRELSRRRLMEASGRKEIGMMVPVVFLILPVTVLFAVYPGLAVLDLNF